MQSSTEIQGQIKQIEREVLDIHGSLDKLTRTQDLLDAHQELKNRADVLGLLRERLEKAWAEEKEQAVLDRRAELEQERDAATEEHNRLDEVFESDMQPLEALILDYLDRLDQTAMQRGRAEARRSEAAYELRGNVDDYDRSALSTSFGWYSNATESARSDVRVCLRELYAARHGMGGRLGLTGQDSGYRPLTSRPQELTEPNTTDAFRAQVVSEFVAKG